MRCKKEFVLFVKKRVYKKSTQSFKHFYFIFRKCLFNYFFMSDTALVAVIILNKSVSVELSPAFISRFLDSTQKSTYLRVRCHKEYDLLQEHSSLQ